MYSEGMLKRSTFNIDVDESTMEVVQLNKVAPLCSMERDGHVRYFHTT